jgi:hypothetical protein
MTRDDMIRMAREAGATREHPEMLPNFWTLTNPDLKRFAELVAAAERARRMRESRRSGCSTTHRMR